MTVNVHECEKSFTFMHTRGDVFRICEYIWPWNWGIRLPTHDPSNVLASCVTVSIMIVGCQYHGPGELGVFFVLNFFENLFNILCLNFPFKRVNNLIKRHNSIQITNIFTFMFINN